MTEIRTGEAPAVLTLEKFGKRFRMPFIDSLFETALGVMTQIEDIACAVRYPTVSTGWG